MGYTHLTVFKAFEIIQSEGLIPDFEALLTEMENDIFGFRMEFNKVNSIKIGLFSNFLKIFITKFNRQASIANERKAN